MVVLAKEYFQSPCEVARSPWFVKLGVGVFLFGEGSAISINDTVVPGAGLEISDAATFAFDIGYQLSPVWTATLSAGVPPRLDLDGTGVFEGASYGTTLIRTNRVNVATTLLRKRQEFNLCRCRR